MAKFRIENDTMGEIDVPDNMLWGAQTQRKTEWSPHGKPLPTWQAP